MPPFRYAVVFELTLTVSPSPSVSTDHIIGFLVCDNRDGIYLKIIPNVKTNDFFPFS
jgi:hypothetical protein